MTDTTKLEKILKENGRSVTRQRLMVFKALESTEHPISTVELVALLPGLDKVSVYRTVELFERIGLVNRVWHGFKSKLELSEAFSPHHHHFSCVSCGKVMGLKSEPLEKTLHQFEQEHGFKLTHHSVELSGFCQDCTAKASA